MSPFHQAVAHILAIICSPVVLGVNFLTGTLPTEGVGEFGAHGYVVARLDGGGNYPFRNLLITLSTISRNVWLGRELCH